MFCKFKNKKGGLSKLTIVVLLLLISIYIFSSTIHPTSKILKNVGREGGMGIIEQKKIIDADFKNLPLDN